MDEFFVYILESENLSTLKATESPWVNSWREKMSDANDDGASVKGTNRDERRERDKGKQIYHPPVLYLGHRAKRKEDERRRKALERKARGKRPHGLSLRLFSGAGDQARTGDILLGRPTRRNQEVTWIITLRLESNGLQR